MNETTISMAAVATSRSWRVQLQAHVYDHLAHVELTVLRDPEQAMRKEYAVIFIDDSVALFADRQIRELVARGTNVIGFFDPTGDVGRGRRSLVELGVTRVLRDDENPVAVLEHVIEQCSTSGSEPDIPAPTSRTTRSKVPAATQIGSHIDPLNSSRLVVVGGPDSAISTEVACGLADAAASRSLALLVDLNEVDPTVAPRLGLRLAPNIIDAIEAATSSNSIADALARTDRDADDGAHADRDENSFFDTVAGIARSSEWQRLTPNGIDRFFAHALTHWDRVVSCVGSRIDEVGQRHAVSRAAVSIADELVITLRPDPVDLVRGLHWLATANELRCDRTTGLLFYGRPSKFRRQELTNIVLDRVPDGMLDFVEFVPVSSSVDKAKWQANSRVGGSFLRMLRSVEQRLEDAGSFDNAETDFVDDSSASEAVRHGAGSDHGATSPTGGVGPSATAGNNEEWTR